MRKGRAETIPAMIFTRGLTISCTPRFGMSAITGNLRRIVYRSSRGLAKVTVETFPRRLRHRKTKSAVRT